MVCFGIEVDIKVVSQYLICFAHQLPALLFLPFMHKVTTVEDAMHFDMILVINYSSVTMCSIVDAVYMNICHVGL